MGSGPGPHLPVKFEARSDLSTVTMTEAGDQLRLDPAQAKALAETMHAQRTRGVEHRALRELIANRLRVKKRVAQALYDQFDRGWHAGVGASSGRGTLQPPLEDDPLGHFAFEAARGQTERLIAERTATPAPSGQAVSGRSFIWRSAIVATVVAAAVWWLSNAAGWRLIGVVGVAWFLTFAISIQMATFIEYCLMLVLALVVAGSVAWAGFGEFFWPALCAALAGAIDGGAQRAAWERLRRHSGGRD